MGGPGPPPAPRTCSGPPRYIPRRPRGAPGLGRVVVGGVSLFHMSRLSTSVIPEAIASGRGSGRGGQWWEVGGPARGPRPAATCRNSVHKVEGHGCPPPRHTPELPAASPPPAPAPPHRAQPRPGTELPAWGFGFSSSVSLIFLFYFYAVSIFLFFFHFSFFFSSFPLPPLLPLPLLPLFLLIFFLFFFLILNIFFLFFSFYFLIS